MLDDHQNRKPNHFHGTANDDRLPYKNGPRTLLTISRLLNIGLTLFLPLAAIQAMLTFCLLMDSSVFIAWINQKSENLGGIDLWFTAEVTYRLNYIACIFFSSWLLFRATRNLHTIGQLELTTKPHWAWLWFFVPIANFYKPFKAVSEIDRATYTIIGKLDPPQKFILTWWLLFISSVFLGATSVTLPGINLYAFHLALDVVSGVLAVMAAILFMRITSDLAANHELFQSLDTSGTSE